VTAAPGAASSGDSDAAADGPAPLIDEVVALRTATLVAPRRRTSGAEVAALRAEVDADLPRIDQAARDWTKLGSQLPPVRVTVVGRTGWVRVNLAAIRGTFEPLRQRLEKRPGAAKVLGVQVGALFGLLSAKVLGQYVLPLGGPGGGQLVIVGPNVLDLAERHGPLAVDIRRAVMLHEVTHRLQFEATPWLGDHLRDLVDRYLRNTREGRLTISDVAPKVPELIEEMRRTGTVQPLLSAVLTEEQVAVIAEAQGLMSLLEGHGNAAMFSAAPPDLITDPEGVRSALANRRNDVTSKVLAAVAGLEMKRRQYREGEAFVREVIDLGGVDGLNRAFESPDRLPVSEDVGDPGGWLARVQAA
jgi:coenzyme F420 biosynthesis associated uncharacterized protein